MYHSMVFAERQNQRDSIELSIWKTKYNMQLTVTDSCKVLNAGYQNYAKHLATDNKNLRTKIVLLQLSTAILGCGTLTLLLLK